MAKPLRDLAVALLWLTRLPVAWLLPRDLPVLAQAAWAFPLVGLAVGLIAGAVLLAAIAAGLSPAIAALLAVGALMLTTGALHEDGLADFADAAGGATRERRLEIMRDSRIGSYGVLALIVVTGLRIAALTALAASPWLAAAALVGTGAASRAGMAAGLGLMPPARADGLGRQAGRPGRGAVGVALLLGAATLLIPAAMSAQPLAAWLLAAGATALAGLWVAGRAMRRLGGQTGDVLGAIQQAGEAAGLVALTMFS